MARRRAVLWDLDGTLLDSSRSIRTAMRHVLRERGLSPFTQQEVQSFIGQPLRDILRRRTRDEGAVESMVARYREVYNGYAWVFVRPWPGCPELVQALGRAGVLQGVVTTKGEDEAAVLVDDLGWRGAMQTVVGDDDRRALKPDPAPVAEACRRLGVAPADATMVGDTVYDMEAGRRAGCRAVGVLWGHGDRESLRQAGALAVASDVAGLGRILLG